MLAQDLPQHKYGPLTSLTFEGAKNNNIFMKLWIISDKKKFMRTIGKLFLWNVGLSSSICIQ